MVRLVLENSDQLVNPLKPFEAAAVSKGTFTLNLPQQPRTDANLSVNPPSSKPVLRPDLDCERNKYDENPAWVHKESNARPASLEYYTSNTQVFAPLLEDPEEAERRLEQLAYTKVRSRERHDRSPERLLSNMVIGNFRSRSGRMAEDLLEKTRRLEQLEGIRLRKIIAELKHREQLEQKCERRTTGEKESKTREREKHDTSKQRKQCRKLWGTLVLDK
jgi:hypothetical protein